MLSTILSLLNWKAKLGIGFGIFFLIVGIICYGSYQSGRIDDLREQLTVSETRRANEKALYDSERQKANDTIDHQNKMIEAYALDEKDYEKVIVDRGRELLVAKIQNNEDIKAALKEDPSVENQLKIIEKLLREFYCYGE